MSASLVTFANLGKKPNLRTTDVLPIVETFERAGELEQVICQIAEGYPSRRVRGAMPPLLRYALRLFEKITRRPFSRRTSEKLFDTFAAWRLRRADLVMLHGSYVMPKTLARAKRLGAATADVSVSANYEANARLEREEFAALGITGYEGLYTRLAKEVAHLPLPDYLVLMSEFAKQTYLEAGYPADRIFIAHLDIDTKRFSPPATPRAKEAPFRVLYLGFTQPLKGIHYLLDAWEMLKLPSAELVIAGGFTDMPPSLEEAYKTRIGRNPSIILMGGVPKPEDLYRDASVFVFPSLTEGFGRSTMEAMACGLPVITTDHAQGIVEEGVTGFVTPVRDSEILKEKIAYLYEHPDEREKMGKAARAAVLAKRPFGEEVFEIYEAILAKEGKRAAVLA